MTEELRNLHPSAAPDAGDPQESAGTIAAIRQRWQKRREPPIGTCASCGHKQEMVPHWQPMATVTAEAQWRCEQCGGQIQIHAFVSTSAGEWPDDDIATLLELLSALPAHQERTEPTDIVQRLTEWLSKGGFFNPAEMAGANEDATRQLILDARTALGAPARAAEWQPLIDQMRICNEQINAAATPEAYHSCLVGLALATREFLRTLPPPPAPSRVTRSERNERRSGCAQRAERVDRSPSYRVHESDS